MARKKNVSVDNWGNSINKEIEGMPIGCISAVTECDYDSVNHAPAKTMPIHEKYAITIKEAAQYFSIGMKKMRRLAEDNLGDFAVYSGNRFLIIRTKFEEYMSHTSEI